MRTRWRTGSATDFEYRMPFKGLYWYGNWEPERLQRHVYPVPMLATLRVHLRHRRWSREDRADRDPRAGLRRWTA